MSEFHLEAERLSRNKHSSLFGLSLAMTKKFYKIDTWIKVIKLFTVAIYKYSQ